MSATIALHDNAQAALLRFGEPAPITEIAVKRCREKLPMQSLSFALNRAWLIASKHRDRAAIYHCNVCNSLHMTRKLGGPGVIVCVWVAP